MKQEAFRWKIISAEHVISAASINQLPKIQLPEFAFIGRSNAGKSTLINRLCNRKNIARVSAMPGKTQQINAYLVTLSNGNLTKKIHITDLPGYSYAKLSWNVRSDLSDLIIDYFNNREQLQLVFLLSDIKRTVDTTDIELRDFIYQTERSVQVVLTKSDKVNQKEKSASLKSNSGNLSLEPQALILAGEKMETTDILKRIIAELM